MAANEEEIFRNQREYSRVEAYIPFEYRLLPPDDHHRLKSRISGDAVLAEFQRLPNIEDPFTAEWLTILSNKLDTIIRMLTFDHEGFYSLPFMSINIGGGGVSFETTTTYTQGDVFEMKLLLSTQRPIALYVYGEVVNIEAYGEGFMISTQFILMDDMIRDEIIRYVFEKEREILREKRRVLF